MFTTLRKICSGLLSASLWHAAPESWSVQLTPKANQHLHTPKFDQILIVDDIAQYARTALEVIGQFYQYSELTVHICHTFTAALTTFQQHKIKLIVLDLDLDDLEGDGALLLQNFRLQSPDIIVLANSSEQKYNDILVKGGANAVVGKSARSLHEWLTANG